MKKMFIALLAAVALTLPFGVARAGATDVLGLLATIDPVTLFAADDPVVNDPANNDPVTDNPKHFPKGGKFKLSGTAARDRDPLNPYNEVISINTTSPDPLCGPPTLSELSLRRGIQEVRRSRQSRDAH